MNFLDIFFPKSCLECGKSGKYFCSNCLAKVQVLNYFDAISQTFSIFRYEGVIRKGIIKIKYNFAYDIAEELAEICASFLVSNQLVSNDYLVPIPLHQSRERWRGFNQSEILGKLIAQKLGFKFKKDLLTRPIQGQNQVGLPKSDRVRNIRGKFAANSNALRFVLSECSESNGYLPTIIVFDDVATTGSTIKEAIKVLKTCLPARQEAGVKKVFGLTIAR